MSEKKIKDPVTLFASIERECHESLRELSYLSHRSIAELAREAINAFLKKSHGKKSQTKRTAKAKG